MANLESLLAGDISEEALEDLVIVINVLPAKGETMTEDQISILRDFLMDKFKDLPAAKEVIDKFKGGVLSGPEAAQAMLTIAAQQSKEVDAEKGVGGSAITKTLTDLAEQPADTLTKDKLISACLDALPPRKRLLARALLSKRRYGK